LNRAVLAAPLIVSALLPAFCLAALDEPSGLAPEMHAPPGERPAFVLHAQGVQVYTCAQNPVDAYAYQWTFVAPEATLRENGAVVGRHGAGPVWESTVDGSSVKGTVRRKQDGGAGNIPWLTMAGTPAARPGRFSTVTTVQRVATKGGVEPLAICDSGRMGQEARVPYAADYYFYTRG
jgi:hypothetical protein